MLAYRLAEIVAGKPDGHRWTFIDGPLNEAFAGVRDDGKVVVWWRGENYVRMPPTLRTRLHNWLINLGNRQVDRR